jgi:hypothetical protein
MKWIQNFHWHWHQILSSKHAESKSKKHSLFAKKYSHQTLFLMHQFSHSRRLAIQFQRHFFPDRQQSRGHLRDLVSEAEDGNGNTQSVGKIEARKTNIRVGKTPSATETARVCMCKKGKDLSCWSCQAFRGLR